MSSLDSSDDFVEETFKTRNPKTQTCLGSAVDTFSLEEVRNYLRLKTERRHLNNWHIRITLHRPTTTVNIFYHDSQEASVVCVKPNIADCNYFTWMLVGFVKPSSLRACTILSSNASSENDSNSDSSAGFCSVNIADLLIITIVTLWC